MSPPAPAPDVRPSLRQRLAGSFTQTGRTLALVWKSSPGGVIGLGLLTIVSATLPPAIVYIGKIIVDAAVAARTAGAGAAEPVVRWVVTELGLVVVAALVERSLGVLRQTVGSRLAVDVNVMILEKALTLQLSHFEDSEFYDKLTRARREASSRPLSLIQGNFQVLRNVLTLLGYVTLLANFSLWMLPALTLASIPAFVSEAKFSNRSYRMNNWRSPESRRLNYLEYVLANDQHVKEVKLFGLGPMLMARYRQLAESFFVQDRVLFVQRATWGFLLSLLSTAAFYGCYVVIARATVRGSISLGAMTAYLVTFRQGQQSFQSILSAVAGMYEDNLYMSNLFSYLGIAVPAAAAGGGLLVRSETGVRFEGVGFRYPGAKDWALRDVSLFIPTGQSLALVGQNGAGKTTFIKLLTRLYQPTEGRILLDGRDLRQWDEAALRSRIGVIFQDFNQYQFLLRENIGVGSVEHLDDEKRVVRAVTRGGASDLVAALSEGIETQLGRWFKNGVELSGGQWQKVALARAFMREEADILVLDEPTAALDAEAEHAIFQHFRELAAGRTTILISHRFPTVRMAGHILVIEKGRIVEQGSHDDLLAAQGRYAQLFTLQAQGYT